MMYIFMFQSLVVALFMVKVAKCVLSFPLLSTTVKPMYNGHPWDQRKWLLYSGDPIIHVQSGFYVMN